MLLQTVHRCLERLEFVESYAVDWGGRGSWGATSVCLQPLPSLPPDQSASTAT